MSEPCAKSEILQLEDPPISIEDLPPPDTKRWVVRRKASVVYAVEKGMIALEDACKRYGISIEEFDSWKRLFEQHGLDGLRVTRLGDYRSEDAQSES